MIAVASQKEETKDQSINQVAYTDINKHDSLSVYRPLVFSSSTFLSTVRHCCLSQFFLLHTFWHCTASLGCAPIRLSWQTSPKKFLMRVTYVIKLSKAYKAPSNVFLFVCFLS